MEGRKAIREYYPEKKRQIKTKIPTCDFNIRSFRLSSYCHRNICSRSTFFWALPTYMNLLPIILEKDGINNEHVSAGVKQNKYTQISVQLLV